MGGSLFLGFCLSRGIRQGCPLSPLLFSASSELILRRIAKLVPEALVRAWADDIAMVVRRGMHRLGHIQHIFHEFAKLSVLALNIEKIVLVPIFPYVVQAVRVAVSILAQLGVVFL